MPIVKFSLLENALDSLAQAVEFALSNRNNPSKLKVAILLVAQAVELVLKERLQREHWSLIFRNVEQARNEDAMTVTIKEAQKRLNTIAGVSLDQSDSEAIENLQRTRNRIQHYEIELSFGQALSQINVAIGFLIRFLHAELGTDIQEHLNAQDYQRLLEVEETLEELRGIAQDRVEEIREARGPARPKDLVAWHFEVIECPVCWEKFYILSISEHLSKCQLCNYEGGFVECDHCGGVFPSGSFDLHCEDDDGYAVCESCWSRIMEE